MNGLRVICTTSVLQITRFANSTRTVVAGGVVVVVVAVAVVAQAVAAAEAVEQEVTAAKLPRMELLELLLLRWWMIPRMQATPKAGSGVLYKHHPQRLLRLWQLLHGDMVTMPHRAFTTYRRQLFRSLSSCETSLIPHLVPILITAPTARVVQGTGRVHRDVAAGPEGGRVVAHVASHVGVLVVVAKVR
jgi:hypothetical protein